MLEGIGAIGAPLGPDCPVEMVCRVSPAELVPLVELTRGGHSECLHFGAIAVVNKHGTVLAHAGNPQFVSFTRSTLKVLQALPLLQSGAAKALGLSQSELALLCASHNGEPMHVQTAESILAKAGQDYRVLRCGCHVPGLFTLLDKAPPDGLVYDERHHNCSGKHAGFVAMCVQQGWPGRRGPAPARKRISRAGWACECRRRSHGKRGRRRRSLTRLLHPVPPRRAVRTA